MEKFQLFRDTAKTKGLSMIITPANSSLKYLSYGRVILDRTKPSEVLSTGKSEFGGMCVEGKGGLEIKGKIYTLGKYDGIYIPRNSECKISTEEEFDLVLSSTPADDKDFPVSVVRFQEVEKDPQLHIAVGNEKRGDKRDVYMIIGQQVQASRLLLGLTVSQPGGWTSWPPHEHGERQEEIYLYIEMPKPAAAIQYVFTDFVNMEFCQVVYDGDAVAIPYGYHPNVAVPGYKLSFIWMMAGKQPGIRDWGKANILPEYKG